MFRKDKKAMNEMAESSFDVLNRFAANLTEKATKGLLDPVIGRDEEIRRVIQVLSRRTKNNPILIGEPGVGKTAIAEGLALRIANNDVPEKLKVKQIFSLDLASILAGAKFRGDFEERLKSLLNENMDPGIADISWNGVNDEGVLLSSGIYFVVLNMNNSTFVEKVTLLK